MTIYLNSFRASIWAAFWVIVNPEILSISAWQSEPMVILKLITLYLISLVPLEIYYREIFWGSVFKRMPYRTAVAPECACNPWICLLDNLPRAGVNCEIFGADGVTRRAQTFETESGKLAINVFFEYAGEMQREEPYDYRPTHWRSKQKLTGMECSI